MIVAIRLPRSALDTGFRRPLFIGRQANDTYRSRSDDKSSKALSPITDIRFSSKYLRANQAVSSHFHNSAYKNSSDDSPEKASLSSVEIRLAVRILSTG